MNSFTPFADSVRDNGVNLSRFDVGILQINLGKMCNQACHHCHVEAGPLRTEIMQKETMVQILRLIDETPSIHTIDMTGGAPEMNPHFRFFVKECTKRNKKLIDRCNLTILFEKGQEDLADFLAENKVKVVASLPCYSKENVEKQRGRGVFDKSIEGLKILNNLGYGKGQTGLELDLVYNPLGAFLPPEQSKLQDDYRKELKELFNIEFNQLFTITNMPIKRFRDDLKRQEKLEEYMQLLLDNFNPTAAEGVMCKELVSLSWDGKLYDCDFNQMLEIGLSGSNISVWDIDSFSKISDKSIALANHCYGCTAGAGSSCSGTLI